MGSELQANYVSVQTKLDDNLPHVMGNRVQLQLVILNLIRNAIEALNVITKRARVPRIKSGGLYEVAEEEMNGQLARKATS